MTFDDADRPKAQTPAIDVEIVRLLQGWQDTDTFVSLHGILQACIATCLLSTGNANTAAPDPATLRHEARDVLAAAWAFAYFLDALADRIQAGSN